MAARRSETNDEETSPICRGPRMEWSGWISTWDGDGDGVEKWLQWWTGRREQESPEEEEEGDGEEGKEGKDANGAR